MTLALIERSEPPKLLNVWPGFSAVDVNVAGVLQAFDVSQGWKSEDGLYELVQPIAFQIPDGKIPAAPPTYSIDENGVVTDSIEVMDRPAPPAPDHRDVAQAALDATDSVALRCFKSGIPFPQEWKDYTASLRVIVRTGEGDIPVRPTYPSGS